jgi:hypothetical protein
MRRAIKLNGPDIELELIDATKIHHPEPFVFLMERAPDQWYMDYSVSFVERFNLVKDILIDGLAAGLVKGRPTQETKLSIVQHDQTTREFAVSQFVGIPQADGLLRRIMIEGTRDLKLKITYSRNLIPVPHEFKGFTIIREDDEE